MWSIFLLSPLKEQLDGVGTPDEPWLHEAPTRDSKRMDMCGGTIHSPIIRKEEL
jgi:hypothetical protein